MRNVVILDGALFARINSYRCSKHELILLEFANENEGINSWDLREPLTVAGSNMQPKTLKRSLQKS